MTFVKGPRPGWTTRKGSERVGARCPGGCSQCAKIRVVLRECTRGRTTKHVSVYIYILVYSLYIHYIYIYAIYICISSCKETLQRKSTFFQQEIHLQKGYKLPANDNNLLMPRPGDEVLSGEAQQFHIEIGTTNLIHLTDLEMNIRQKGKPGSLCFDMNVWVHISYTLYLRVSQNPFAFLFFLGLPSAISILFAWFYIIYWVC